VEIKEGKIVYGNLENLSGENPKQSKLIKPQFAGIHRQEVKQSGR